MASLIFCASVHAVVCAMLLHGNKILMGTLFGIQSLGCVVLTAFPVVHCLMHAHRPRRRWTDPEIYLTGRCFSQRHIIRTDASGEEFVQQAPETSTTSYDPTGCWMWLLVLLVGVGDVLWALCGVRSCWFVVTLSPIPAGARAPMAALAVGVIVSTVLLGMGHTVATVTSLGPQVLVEVGCVPLPCLLLLAQLASRGAAPPSPGSPRCSPSPSASGSAPPSPKGRRLEEVNTHVDDVGTSPARSCDCDIPSSKRTSDFRMLRKTRVRQSAHKPLRYSVASQIASGGFSDVFLGLSHDTGDLICLKQLKVGFAESDMASMEAEVSLLKQLAHPNIVQYFGTDRRGERFTILLEYVPGGSIETVLSEFGALEEEVVRLYMRQAVCGLEYLHLQGFVHGDIKGANILVSDKGEVRLSDFGCSYSSRASQGDCLAMGTVLWMAPEKCRQERSNSACDVWSLGCTILQMATNQEPWSERRFEHIISGFYHIATCQEPPQVPSTICGPMRHVVLQCLQLEPLRRPSCTDLLATVWLATNVDGMDGLASLPTPETSPRWSRLQLKEQPKHQKVSSFRSDSSGSLQKQFSDVPGQVPSTSSLLPVTTAPILETSSAFFSSASMSSNEPGESRALPCVVPESESVSVDDLRGSLTGAMYGDVQHTFRGDCGLRDGISSSRSGKLPGPPSVAKSNPCWHPRP